MKGPLIAGLLFVRMAFPAGEGLGLFSNEGYRLEDFRAPVPDSFPGGSTLDTSQVWRLLERQGAIPVDVLPQPPEPENRPPGFPWLPPERLNIPGSVWLPNVGFGRLSDEMDRYFRRNLESVTGGDRDRKLVFYCLADCWMSWNAARRAVDYGYTSVYWYPQGTSGWASAGLPLARSKPVPPTGP